VAPEAAQLSAGLFKIKSTPAQALPTDEDLFQSITRGLPGSSMPGHLSQRTGRRELVQYVKHLTAFTDSSGNVINRFAEAAASGPAVKPVEVPAEPAATVQGLILGREMFKKMQCALCHGETGAGDGPQVPTLRDASGLPVRPRDFNTGLLRGGHRGRDLYLRIHNGLPGTPMIPYGDEQMKPAERWALVHYVQSLRRSDVAVNDLLAPEDSAIGIRRVKKLPPAPWTASRVTRPVRVHSIRCGGTGPGLCRRRFSGDRRPNSRCCCNGAMSCRSTPPSESEGFQDAAALRFSLSGQYGFLGMGDAQNPVNLWNWKAGWRPSSRATRPTF
jgi:mono/diheme cytochrome c family protein